MHWSLGLAIIFVLLGFQTASAKPRRKFTLHTPTAKIIEGTDVVRRNSSHQHPFLVSIQYFANNEYRHTCGGAILDQWTVVTAAHCFTDHHSDLEYRIVAGIHNLSKPEDERHQISKFSSDAIEEHVNFDGFHFDNDISLIHLEEPLNYTGFVKPIRLINSDRPYKKTNAIIVGWGKSLKHAKSLDDAPEVTPVLQEAFVNIYSEEQCLHQWGDDYHPENMICAAGRKDNGNEHGSGKVPDACQGDSGGPLVAKDMVRKRRYLIGLVSWGYECGVQEYPGIYTKVEKYLPWLQEKRQNMKLKRQHRSSPGCASNLN